jgi:hypothetical protein
MISSLNRPVPNSGGLRPRSALGKIPGRDALSYTPVAPSMRSRIMSAWPLWRAYSSIMWT